VAERAVLALGTRDSVRVGLVHGSMASAVARRARNVAMAVAERADDIAASATVVAHSHLFGVRYLDRKVHVGEQRTRMGFDLVVKVSVSQSVSHEGRTQARERERATYLPRTRRGTHVGAVERVDQLAHRTIIGRQLSRLEEGLELGHVGVRRRDLADEQIASELCVPGGRSGNVCKVSDDELLHCEVQRDRER